jgi:hypothetical protein
MKTYFRLSLIILCTPIFALSSYGQTNRFVSVGIYNSNLVKYLLPEIKGSDTIEIISFIEKPAFEPESAFRIIRSHDQYTLEGRFCKKNYWEAIFPYFGKNVTLSAPEISFYSLKIGNEFADQLISAFYEEINKGENKKYLTLDGYCYVLRYKVAGRTISKTIDNPLNTGFRLCETSSKLAKDIKNQTFEESKYLNLIKRVNKGEVYNSNLTRFLLPAIKGSDTTEIISFVEKPSFEGESAFRIIRSHDQYTLEGRFCEKNYWYAIYPYFETGEAVPAPVISFRSYDISKELANKFISAFHEEVNNPEKPEEKIYKTINGLVYRMQKETVDGVSYVLRDLSSGEISSKTLRNPEKNDPAYNLCVTSSKLAKDVKNQTFEESKFPNPIKRNDPGEVYNSNLIKYLLPAIKGPDTTEIISFVEKPAFQPESAFRIIRSRNKYSLEGRFCKKNYWNGIYPYLVKGETIPAPEISFCSYDVSEEFANKFISAVHEEVNKPGKPDIYKTVNGVVYRMEKISADGVSYILRSLSSGAISSKMMVNFEKDEPAYNLCMTSSKLALDLKNQTFKESKYVNVVLP